MLIPLKDSKFQCAFVGSLAVPAPRRLDTAFRWLDRYIKVHALSCRRPAVVFDIDDTLRLARSGEPLAQAVKLLQDCSRNGVAVFLVTARSEDRKVRELTRTHLEQIDIPATLYARLYLMDRARYRLDDHGVSCYKRDCRDEIRREHGRTVIANVGDNMTDHVCYPLSSKYRALHDMSKHDVIIFINNEEADFNVACLKLPLNP